VVKFHTEYLTFDTPKRREYVNAIVKVMGACAGGTRLARQASR